MDVDGQRKRAEQIVFVKTAPTDPLRPAPAPRKLSSMDIAEMDLMKGNTAEAADLAGKALTDPAADHGRATYLLARVDLMEGRPDKAMQGFQSALSMSHDPRTLAWSHIYIGRLYDIETDPERDKAIAEYKTALAVRDSRPDTRQAAEAGLARPFALPQRAALKAAATDAGDQDADKDFDPTGKAEKDAYKPPPSPPVTPH
jgi:tetratricopeptide (TPR) repeat protein